MKRRALAACLLALPGLAAAFEVSIGPNPVIVNPPPPPVDLTTLPPFESQVFLIAPLNFSSVHRFEDQKAGIPVAPNPGSMLLGEPAIVTIEEDGVRMPDEQFTLP